ncbi:Gfo/Idh/MocA family oxidoreductase, partial [Escherichia sp. TWPC-MK]
MKSAMTSSPLRVAIIGAGQVADKVHASYYCTRNDLELVAVCDSRLSQAQALADKYGLALYVIDKGFHAAQMAVVV